MAGEAWEGHGRRRVSDMGWTDWMARDRDRDSGGESDRGLA